MKFNKNLIALSIALLALEFKTTQPEQIIFVSDNDNYTGASYYAGEYPPYQADDPHAPNDIRKIQQEEALRAIKRKEKFNIDAQKNKKKNSGMGGTPRRQRVYARRHPQSRNQE